MFNTVNMFNAAIVFQGANGAVCNYTSNNAIEIAKPVCLHTTVGH